MGEERAFDLADQGAFARLSGDFNPLHVDPVAARRLLPGRAVVHGVHLLMWALDRALAARAGRLRIEHLDVQFRKSVGVGESATLDIERSGQLDRCRVRCGAALAVEVEVRWSPGLTAQDHGVAAMLHEAHAPDEVAGEALVGMSGRLMLGFDAPARDSLFPTLAVRLVALQCAELLATTRLIGMICPGLHSIFSRLSLTASPNVRGDCDALQYRVRKFDERFSLARIDVEGPSLGGTLDAFYRPSPMKQPSFESLVGRVECDAFAGVDALVIGGSRGLGEVATKLLAAGGARVAFTYHRGVREAVALSAEIDSSGERVRAFALDVRDPGPAAAPILSWLGRVSHLLYFASGPIFVAERGVFDSRLFRSFCDVYVTGFVETVAKFGESGLTHVLYPSSSALDELPLDMGEYVAAKAAGEVACAYLAKTRRGLVVDAPRLPRLATDQTRSLVQVTDATPETLLAPILRAMRP